MSELANPDSRDLADLPDQTIDRGHRNVALLVAGVLFMQMLDGTIVTTSSPRIARSLHVPVGNIALVITAYLVTVAVLVPLSGWVAARFGGRATFLAAIIIFTLASAGCAASRSFPELIAMRVFQAIGGATMVPVGRLLVLARADASNLMRLTNLLVWPGLVAPVAAPLVGGAISTYTSWHWLFLINVPLGLVAVLISARIVHPPSLPQPGPFDLAGLGLVAVGLGGLTITADLLARSDSNWGQPAAVATVSAVVLAAAVRHLARATAPLVDLRLTRIHTFRSALMGTIFHWSALNAVPFLAPLLFVEVFHWSALKAGSLVLFIFLGNLGAKTVTTYLYSRFGFRPTLIASTASLAFSVILLGAAGTSSSTVLLALILLVSGVGRSVGATGYSTVIYSDVPNLEMRHASTLVTTVQQLGATWGVAAGAIALRLGRPIARLFGASGGGHTAYTVAFVLVAFLELSATFAAVGMSPTSGDALRGTRSQADQPATGGLSSPIDAGP